jgi:hypothetical protein
MRIFYRGPQINSTKDHKIKQCLFSLFVGSTGILVEDTLFRLTPTASPPRYLWRGLFDDNFQDGVKTSFVCDLSLHNSMVQGHKCSLKIKHDNKLAATGSAGCQPARRASEARTAVCAI